MAPERTAATLGHTARTFPRRVLRAVPFGRWRAEEKGKEKKIPSVREGWRGARGPCQVQAGRSDQGDASQSSPRRPARRRRRAEGSGARAAAATSGGRPPRFVAPRPRTKAAEAVARGSGFRDAREACAMHLGPRSLSQSRRRHPARTRKQEKGVLGLGGSSAVASRPARPAPLWLAGPGSIIDAPELYRAHALRRGAWRES